MSYQKILNTALFQTTDGSYKEVHIGTYNEIRSLIVEYSRKHTHWREIHTGLIIVRAELLFLSEESASETVASYAKRLLVITEGLIAQIEMAVKANADLHPSSENKQESVDNTVKENVVFTGKYSDFVEVIHLICEANFINSGSKQSRIHIIKELHRFVGLEYDPKKFHNAKNGIERRCPAEGCRVTYFLDDIIDKVNARLAA